MDRSRKVLPCPKACHALGRLPSHEIATSRLDESECQYMLHHGDHTPQTLVGISFPDVFRAQEFLTAATGLAKHGRLKLVDAVMVIKNADGKVVVHETTDPQPGRAALSGAMWAGLFGLLLGGPVGWLAGAALGAGAGVATAQIIDLGISDSWVTWFRDSVKPDTAILALLVTDLDRTALVDEAARFTGAELVYANLDTATIDRIKAALGDTTPSSQSGDTPTDHDLT